MLKISGQTWRFFSDSITRLLAISFQLAAFNFLVFIVQYLLSCFNALIWFHLIFPSDDISISVAVSIYPPMSFVSGHRTQCTCSIYCWSWFTILWSVRSATGYCVHWLRHKHGVHVSSMEFLHLSVDGEIAEMLRRDKTIKHSLIQYGSFLCSFSHF